MNSYNAVFYKGGYLNNFLQTENNALIVKTKNDMDDYINDILTETKNNSIFSSEEYYVSLETDIKNHFSKYNNNFFKTKTLVLAVVDAGSGSFKYTLSNLKYNNGELNLEISRNNPGICTMDYVQWTLELELDKSSYSDISSVKFELIKTNPASNI